MKATQGGLANVNSYDVRGAGTYITGTSCSNFRNVEDSHYGTLYALNASNAVCNNYCDIIADCSSSGV